jgi:hypothetical protein
MSVHAHIRTPFREKPSHYNVIILVAVKGLKRAYSEYVSGSPGGGSKI